MGSLVRISFAANTLRVPFAWRPLRAYGISSGGRPIHFS